MELQAAEGYGGAGVSQFVAEAMAFHSRGLLRSRMGNGAGGGSRTRFFQSAKRALGR